MARETYLDEIIFVPEKIKSALINDDSVVSLIVDKPIEEIQDDDRDMVLDRYVYDYQYVDNTVTESAAFIMIDTNIPRAQNENIKSLDVYVTVACHKEYMKLDGKKFPGIAGNRRDNIVRFIDKVLGFADGYGIGLFTRKSVDLVTGGNLPFAFKTIHYTIPEFNKVEIE